MRQAVVERLLEINRAFYQTLGEAFAATRPRPQPGVARVLQRVPAEDSVLDVGCGHGLVASTLLDAGHRGPYLGLDASDTLLALARQRAASWARFRQADVSRPGWPEEAELATDRFDWLLAFAVLHHLPGAALRRRIAAELRERLSPTGQAVVSVWDFAKSPRLQARIVDWSEVSLHETDVEPGDALLDWRAGGHGLRYVHRFSPAELTDLAGQGGFAVRETFWSDGEGGRLGLYQVWGPAVA